MYLIKEASKISGVSVRTLHYYDEIGLLSPQKYKNGYRYYSEDDMDDLQMILFYKHLGFSLRQIKVMLNQNENKRLPHLRKQLILMQEEKQKILTLIDTLEKTIEYQERRVVMTTKEKFNGFNYEDNKKYEKIAMGIYGKEVVEGAIEKHKGKEKELIDGFNEIFFSFSENLSRGIDAISEENTDLAKKIHEHICKYVFDCSMEVFSGIGYGYAKNPEFKNNIDKFGDGTAQYVCDAIQEYVHKKEK